MEDVSRERVAFADAISHPKLLKKPWEMLSLPQQVVLKSFYGLPLETEQEIIYWSAFQGAGIFDELGYLQGISHQVPYSPKEYEILTAILGRRSGKSDRIGGFSAAYEILLGGHTKFIRRAAVDEDGKKVKGSEDQDVFWLYIAQDLGTAMTNMKFVLGPIDESPVLRRYVDYRNTDEVGFKNGIKLRPEPPTIRTGRGVPVIGISMDEFAFWYKDSKSANPDFEVVRALEYSLSQFPNAKQLRLSTPWTKEGMLFQAHEHGTEGKKLKCEKCESSTICVHVAEDREDHEGHLVVQAPTAMMGNPFITRKFLKRKARDKEAFARESLTKFVDSQTSFLTWASIERAIDRKLESRHKIDGVDYIVAIDPAFRRDSFAITVVHHEKERGIVQDFVFGMTPEPGERLNPARVLDKVKEVAEFWGTTYVWSDQYHLESLQALAEERDFAIIGEDLTVKSKPQVMNNLASLLNQSRMRLLDHGGTEGQLKRLRKTLGPTGYERIAAPNGEHDDFATVLALAATKALELPPAEVNTNADGRGKHPYLSEQVLAGLRAKYEQMAADNPEFAERHRQMQNLLELYGD
jgi:hypothetical protein